MSPRLAWFFYFTTKNHRKAQNPGLTQVRKHGEGQTIMNTITIIAVSLVLAAVVGFFSVYRRFPSVQVFMFNKDGKIYLQERHPDISFGGCYSVPGGKKEKNNSLLQTVEEELLEETGLNIDGSIAKLIGKSARWIWRKNRLRHYVIYQYVVDITGQTPKIASPDEAVADGTFTIQEALNLKLTQRVREKLEEIQKSPEIVK